MLLKELSYSENISLEGRNAWELEKLSLGAQNLIIGKNATGKTRILNVLHNLAKMIQSPERVLDGNWQVSFLDKNSDIFEYSLIRENGKVSTENISLGGKLKLERSFSKARIFSEKTSRWQDISPPNDRLVLHVRRDEAEFPFLENLFSWSLGVRGLSFSNATPNLIEIPGNPFQLQSLNAVPSILEKLTPQQVQKVLNQLATLGYPIEDAFLGLVSNLPPTAKCIYLKEANIAVPLNQFEISQGMFRTFSLLTILEFLRTDEKIAMILVDDFGEGIDFERAKKLAEIIFVSDELKNIQFVATSNDPFLINAISLNFITVSYRLKNKVKCLNLANAKDKFQEWQQLGLSNFDLFSSDFLLKK